MINSAVSKASSARALFATACFVLAEVSSGDFDPGDSGAESFESWWLDVTCGTALYCNAGGSPLRDLGSGFSTERTLKLELSDREF